MSTSVISTFANNHSLLAGALTRGVEELEHLTHPGAPRLLVMLGPLRLDVLEVVVGDPALGRQRIAQRAGVRDNVRTLTGAGVEPDTQRQLGAKLLDLADNHSTIPPHRRRKHREPIEGGRILEPEMHREQAAEGRPAEASAR